MVESSVKPLCNAIIAQMIKDYTGDDDKLKGEAKLFFKSEWFIHLSDGMDGNAILHRLDTKLKQFQHLCDKYRPEIWKDAKEAAKCEFSCPFCNERVKIQWNRRGDKRYYFQCEGCGVRAMRPFIGKVLEQGNKKCSACSHYTNTEKHKTSCLLHEIHVTPTSWCEDYEERSKKE